MDNEVKKSKESKKVVKWVVIFLTFLVHPVNEYP